MSALVISLLIFNCRSLGNWLWSNRKKKQEFSAFGVKSKLMTTRNWQYICVKQEDLLSAECLRNFTPAGKIWLFCLNIPGITYVFWSHVRLSLWLCGKIGCRWNDTAWKPMLIFPLPSSYEQPDFWCRNWFACDTHPCWHSGTHS